MTAMLSKVVTPKATMAAKYNSMPSLGQAARDAAVDKQAVQKDLVFEIAVEPGL